MSEQGKLTAPPHGLSLQFVTAEAMHVDWRELYQNGDEYDVALPPVTYADVAERAPDLMEEWNRVAVEETGSDYDPAAELDEEHLDEFRQTQGYDEWADQYQPAMNYAWPVSLAYGGPSAEEAARLIDLYAGACTLISFADGSNPFGEDSDAPEYAIALTGGGMDLSDHIAVAYLCCGCVPPERILSGLDNFTGCNRSGKLSAAADLLRDAYARAAEYFRNRASRLEEMTGRLELRGEDA